MDLTFWVTEQNTGEPEHTLVESNIKSFSESPFSIKGIDYFSSESRYCKLTVNVDSWIEANLVVNPEIIKGTSILIYLFKFTKDGKERVYYIDLKSVKPMDKKNNELSFIGIDLSGVLWILAKDEKSFDITITNFSTLLDDYLTICLRNGSHEKIIFNINIPDDLGSFAVTDFDIKYPNRSLYLGETPHRTYSGIPNDLVIDLNWQFIGNFSGVTTLVFVDLHYHFWLDAYNDEHESLTVKHLRIHFDNDIDYTIHTNEHYTNYGYTNGGMWTNIISNFDYLYSAKGFDGINPVSTLTYGTYTLSESYLTFSGDIDFNVIQLQETEEGTGILTATYKDFFRALLLYNNLYLYADGNDLNIGKKNEFSGQGTAIDDDDIIEEFPSNLVISDFIKDEILNIVADLNYIDFIIDFYEDLFETTTKKTEIEILNNDTYGFNLLDRIKVSDVHYTITSISTDNDSLLTKIEGWG